MLRASAYAPVAQLDRVPGFEPGGREFESLRARHFVNKLLYGAFLQSGLPEELVQTPSPTNPLRSLWLIGC